MSTYVTTNSSTFTLIFFLIWTIKRPGQKGVSIRNSYFLWGEYRFVSFQRGLIFIVSIVAIGYRGYQPEGCTELYFEHFSPGLFWVSAWVLYGCLVLLLKHSAIVNISLGAVLKYISSIATLGYRWYQHGCCNPRVRSDCWAGIQVFYSMSDATNIS